MKRVFTFLTIVVCGIFLLLSLRGLKGEPTKGEFLSPVWTSDGPFELSPERGRFGLTYSMVHDKSFQFSLTLARFITPDVGYVNGKYVSLFQPGVSFIAIPFYIIGHQIGFGQLASFGAISIFALLNLILIRKISQHIGVNDFAASAGAMIFLFATPAFSYAVDLYQHHVSTFLLLTCVYLLLKSKAAWATFLVFFYVGFSILVDFPNIFVMFPIGLVAFRNLFHFDTIAKGRFKLSIKISKPLLMIIGLAIPLATLFWFNAKSYGSPFKISGSAQQVHFISAKGEPIEEDAAKQVVGKKDLISVAGWFETRNLLNGLYTHVASSDRGIIEFTPIIITGLIGFLFLYKKSPKAAILIISISCLNVLTYSTWDDPWGGWAFGSRYLIPSYAFLSIGAAALIHEKRRNVIVILVVLVLGVYSIFVNSAGALTTSANPPKKEIEFLEHQTGINQKYTFERNLDLLKNNRSKSYLFQAHAKNHLKAWDYFVYIASTISLVFALQLLLSGFSKKND